MRAAAARWPASSSIPAPIMRRERQVVAGGSVVLRATANELRLTPAAVVADLIAVGVPRC